MGSLSHQITHGAGLTSRTTRLAYVFLAPELLDNAIAGWCREGGGGLTVQVQGQARDMGTVHTAAERPRGERPGEDG